MRKPKRTRQVGSQCVMKSQHESITRSSHQTLAQTSNLIGANRSNSRFQPPGSTISQSWPKVSSKSTKGSQSQPRVGQRSSQRQPNVSSKSELLNSLRNSLIVAPRMAQNSKFLKGFLRCRSKTIEFLDEPRGPKLLNSFRNSVKYASSGSKINDFLN